MEGMGAVTHRVRNPQMHLHTFSIHQSNALKTNQWDTETQAETVNITSKTHSMWIRFSRWENDCTQAGYNNLHLKTLEIKKIIKRFRIHNWQFCSHLYNSANVTETNVTDVYHGLQWLLLTGVLSLVTLVCGVQCAGEKSISVRVAWVEHCRLVKCSISLLWVCTWSLDRNWPTSLTHLE